MKFPLSMLREFVETQLDAHGVGDLLTMAGFELEGIETIEGDDVLDVKVVSNRGDGLSVFGLSREILAKDSESRATDLYSAAVSGFPLGDETDLSIREATSVRIESPDCSRYAARWFDSVSNSESPEWLQRRLRQAGLRPLGVLVDLSNYVMLELGQPLHAFDADTLAERRIVVRGALAGERLTTLNGVEHELEPHHLMICDALRPVAVAGVMGGAETEVGPTTTTVLLESAHFSNTSVRRTRKELGLNTDASYRFERSVDPEGVVRGLNRYAHLLAECQPSARRRAGVVDEFPGRAAAGTVQVRMSRVARLLGMDVSPSEGRSYLERLGFEVGGDGEPFAVKRPSWRPDIEREEDLIEEIGRVHGYERIPTRPPSGSSVGGGLHGFDRAIERLHQALLRNGLVQVVSHSLRDEHPLDSPHWERIGPKNPVSSEMAWLRSSLWPGLADAVLRNGGRDAFLFEVGRVHGQIRGDFVEGRRASVLLTGNLAPAPAKSAAADFSTLKRVADSSLRALGTPAEWRPASSDSRLHPTRQAELWCGDVRVGVAGQIHPLAAEASDLPDEAFLAEIDLDAAERVPRWDRPIRAISRNPAVRRDISVLLPREIAYAQIEAEVHRACGETLEKLLLSDVYAGAGIPSGFHSLTLTLQLRKFGENFTDEEANQVRDAAVAALGSLGGTQR